MNTTQPPTLLALPAGTYPDGNNSDQPIEFSESVLKSIVDNYDPALHEAPIVKGHPQGNGPAYGWVAGVALSDSGIEATTKQVDANFAEEVKNGRFKKISSSFYRPDSPYNPTPGSYYLRHIGLFGDTPVVAKAGRDAEFSEQETESDYVYVDFSELTELAENSWSIAQMGRSLREWMIEKFGIDEADKVVPAYVAENLEDAARHPVDKESVVSDFSEPNKNQSSKQTKEKPVADTDGNAEFAEKQAQFEKDQKELAAKQKKFAAEQMKQVRAENVSFCESMVAKSPGDDRQAQALALLNSASVEAHADFAEFAEADDAQVSQRDLMKQFMKGLPDAVNFGEVVGDEAQAAPAVDANVPAGYTVDADRAVLLSEATAYQVKNNVDFVTAYKAVGGK